MTLEQPFKTLGGRITCLQCNANSKRTGLQCRAPAAKGKAKCRFHGGASTGPTTEQGRQLCAKAKTVHGNETRKARTDRAVEIRRLAVLEAVGFALGLMSGTRTVGRRPNRMGEAFPELKALCHNLLLTGKKQ